MSPPGHFSAGVGQEPQPPALAPLPLPALHSLSGWYKIPGRSRPRWSDHLMDAVRPMAVEHWLKHLELAPKTKHHIRALMHQIFEAARRWELTASNPMELVRVKDSSKRLKTPLYLKKQPHLQPLSLLKQHQQRRKLSQSPLVLLALRIPLWQQKR